MERIIIEGGAQLTGEIPISGAKNALLPLMVAGLLTDEVLHFENAPRLTDTSTLMDLLRDIGATVDMVGSHLTMRASHIRNVTASYELVSKMRASFWVIGPLLARCGQARVSLPGGDAIGARTVDLYLKSLRALGTDISVDKGYIIAHAPHGLKGTRIDLPLVSVGVTHVLLMTASLAEGVTTITNAAMEPEIINLGDCLIKMGAKITGLGTRKIEVTGVDKLSGARHRVIPDRIEAGAYALAIAATCGKATLTGITFAELGALLPAMQEAGVKLSENKNGICVANTLERPLPCDIITAPYPGFATDLQAPFMGLMCYADGTSRIQETIFENRFMHVQELARLGARIRLDGDTALITGVPELRGAQVRATDLRASVTLAIAGLRAKGTTVISDIYHLDRGYEKLEEKLSACGATIWRETTP